MKLCECYTICKRPRTNFATSRTYYDQKSGSRYSIGRIPIAGTDFSSRPYTYDDVENDAALKHFALTQDDYELKIPYIKKALELNPEIKFYASSWSAPSWMKTNNERNGFGKDNIIASMERKIMRNVFLFYNLNYFS